jgi:hypothetical protein
VGFGVARSYYSGDARASVRGTSNRWTPTLFLYISYELKFNHHIVGVNMEQQITMSNIDYELSLQEGFLNISYSSFYANFNFPMNGQLSSDRKTFIAQSRVLGTCRDLSQTEIDGIKSYISDHCRMKRGIEIVFL